MLWRHGRTAWNAVGRFQGQSDVELDEVGRAQAERAARLLAALRPDAIVSSDLRRAADTAAALAAVTGLQVGLDPRLRETYAGTWQGLSRVEIVERDGDALPRWSAGEDVRPGGGESRAEVATRMVEAIQEALDGLAGDATLVVTTHGGSSRVAIGRLLGLPQPLWGALGALSNCSWSVLDPGPQGWRLLEHNAGSLPEPVLGDER